VTLSVAIGISLLVSLSTTPMMCAKLLRRRDESARRQGRLARGAERAFAAVVRGYGRSLAWVLRHPLPTLLVMLATIGLNFWLYTIVPKGFFPQQDTGRIMAFARADQSSSFQAMRTKLENLHAIVMRDPAVENVTGFTGSGGFGARNSANMFIALKPLKERDSMDVVVARLRAALGKEPGANVFLNPIQDLRGGGRQSEGGQQFTLRGDDVSELRTWGQRLERELRASELLTDVSSDQQNRSLQATLVVDRPTAARLGITMRNVDTALGLAFGQTPVSTIYQARNQYRVILEAAPEYWQTPATLDSIHLLSPTRGLVPLSAIARYETTLAPLSVSHQGQFASTTVSFNLAPGVAMSQAADHIRDTMARMGVPNTVYASFEGTSRIFQQGLENQPWLILAALLTVYIVLGILYESLVHPITILSTLPSAGVGALLALLIFKTEFSLIALIGVILLIGIVKKNAILMIDFALDAERREGKSPRDAIYEAAVLRFRPIMMTTMAAMLGAIPLAVGLGDGAELRRPLGISIVGGLFVSQLLTLYTTPVVYLYLDRVRLWGRRKFRRAHPQLAVEGRGA
jgi:multidrug efflux pump